MYTSGPHHFLDFHIVCELCQCMNPKVCTYSSYSRDIKKNLESLWLDQLLIAESGPIIWPFVSHLTQDVMRPSKPMAFCFREEPFMIWGGPGKSGKKNSTATCARKRSSSASCRGKKKLNTNSLSGPPPQIINGPSLMSCFTLQW